MKAMLIMWVLIPATICCCCGGSWPLGDSTGVDFEQFMGGDFEKIVQQVTQSEELQQLLGTPTPAQTPEQSAQPAPAEEAAPAQESAPAEEAAPAQESAPAEEAAPAQESAPAENAAPAPDTPPTEAVPPDQMADDIVQSLLDHMEEGGGAPFTFGCEGASLPMPEDVEGCVSVAGFTNYSTALSQEEVDKMYTDYFTGQGWKRFPDIIQGEVINAWSNDKQGMAMLSFVPGEGEGGKNLVSVGVLAE
jgi:hypothetical protein